MPACSSDTSGSTSWFYDSRGRVTSVSSGGVSASFVYDRDGNRVPSTMGGVTTYYIGNDYEWTGNTSTAKKYNYAGALRVAVRTGSSTLNFLLGDHLGSTSITADGSRARWAASNRRATRARRNARHSSLAAGGVILRHYVPQIDRVVSGAYSSPVTAAAGSTGSGGPGGRG